ncbi:cytochrome C oxidase copper chaperone-domain-containing protein [Rhodotorula diobovata]|uniref:Cytochrome C oxidase copper chaperone-domain-containing protein n=1 Tax=Rhodotorula diobovata TaxID=5288 RepID=A0A5C5FYB9_9BASI|nr:cytochrome C oxidase copper chaperone-domain-containing protein [Rhodotorula diobovata]
MWPFSSSSSSPSATSSPSASPVPPTGPVSIHPTLGRPLTNSEAADPKLNPRNPEGQKPCCACPETKKARDDCFLRFGSNADDSADSANACKDIVEKHRQCMRSLGFNV